MITTTSESLGIVAPELALAVYAMGALLVAGLHPQGRHRAAAAVDHRRGVRGAGPRGGAPRARHRAGLRRHVRGRRLRAVLQDRHPAVGGGGPRDGAGLHARARPPALRVSGARRAVGHGHDGDGQRWRPHDPLHGPGAAVARRLRDRRLAPRLGALHRGGVEVLRARRALFGAAALRRLAGLRLRGHHAVRGRVPLHGGRRVAGPPVRARVRDLGARVQGLGRAVPHVDARRLRGLAHPRHRLLRHRPQGRGDGALRARDPRRLRRRGGRLAPGPGAPVGGVDVPRRRGRDRPARRQAPDGLLLDRAHGPTP